MSCSAARYILCIIYALLSVSYLDCCTKLKLEDWNLDRQFACPNILPWLCELLLPLRFLPLYLPFTLV